MNIYVKGSIIIALLLISVGLIVIYDSFSYSDVDSKAFPITIAVSTIFVSIIIIIVQLFNKDSSNSVDVSRWKRRVLLVLSMAAAILTMPYIGFIPAITAVFIGTMLTAKYGKWTLKQVSLYLIVSGIIIFVFYSLFSYVLLVPLP